MVVKKTSPAKQNARFAFLTIIVSQVRCHGWARLNVLYTLIIFNPHKKEADGLTFHYLSLSSIKRSLRLKSNSDLVGKCDSRKTLGNTIKRITYVWIITYSSCFLECSININEFIWFNCVPMSTKYSFPSGEAKRLYPSYRFTKTTEKWMIAFI